MRYLLFIIVLGAILLTTGCVSQNQNPVPATATVYFFYGEECPHCHTVMPFIESLSEKYPEVDFLILETWHNDPMPPCSDHLIRNSELSIPGCRK
jgi:thiol-disulfide isomerase/thioredoxin